MTCVTVAQKNAKAMSRLRHILAVVIIALFSVGPTVAQEQSALAKVDPAISQIVDTWGGMAINLGLSQGVPYRVFTLVQPNRLVLDFREVNWAGVSKDSLLNSDKASDVWFGPLQPGWSRMVVALDAPLKIETVSLNGASDDPKRVLRVDLVDSDQDSFDQRAGAPIDTTWDIRSALKAPTKPDDDRVVIVLDPGHGGIDPGAEVDGHRESDLVLNIAFDLRDLLRRMGGFDVRMTRDSDVFVSLEGRIAAANQAEADVFLSLHADVVPEGTAAGATAYTLSETASDAASARIAARHDRADILAGIDLTDQDDQIATVLMELARLETEPKSLKLAGLLIDQLIDGGVRVHKNPNRQADFAVLKSPSVPSVLLEVGFMSDPTDLANLLDPVSRDVIVSSIALAIEQWAIEAAAEAKLLRQ